ncbi:MAG: 16S rRNA (cytosine967-C5)-methyltransferase [Glaciecola sp.]|jgi:16S rRNA (cytosine967-C5)-methyltransferase
MSGDGLAPRRAALRAITDVEIDGAWSTIAVPERVGALPELRDRALASRLAYDTIRWRDTLDWALSSVSSRTAAQIEPDLLRVLRLGTLQLLRMRVPHRAVVDTSVTLARQAVPKARAQGAGGFVNGVLRNLVRRLDGEGLPWPEGDDDAALALRTAHPAWVVADVRATFGSEAAATILAADNESPGLTLRANGDVDDLVAELIAAGVEARRHEVVDQALCAPGADPRQLACVAEGRAVPQDAASMLVSLAVAPGLGHSVLDMCAGPGGKSTHLAHLIGTTGTVTALELHEHRARLISGAAQRQLLTNVDVVVADALETGASDITYDRVLLDAPCTGLGVGRRRPEVRWRRTPEDVVSLADLQARLLVRAASQVAPDGRLVYAVCTWTAAETTGVLSDPRVLKATEGFAAPEVQQIRPDLHDADAMFIATFDRT